MSVYLLLERECDYVKDEEKKEIKPECKELECLECNDKGYLEWDNNICPCSGCCCMGCTEKYEECICNY